MTRFAETWLDVGRLPLRRRDRAAMVLALNVARGEHGFPSDALAALRSGRTDLVRALADDADNADYPDDCWGPGKRVERRCFARLVRARLALLLRVLLRVDAGDCVTRHFPYFDASVFNVDGADGMVCDVDGCDGRCAWGSPIRVAPLWESAR